jgi:hypothetical protein
MRSLRPNRVDAEGPRKRRARKDAQFLVVFYYVPGCLYRLSFRCVTHLYACDAIVHLPTSLLTSRHLYRGKWSVLMLLLREIIGVWTVRIIDRLCFFFWPVFRKEFFRSWL